MTYTIEAGTVVFSSDATDPNNPTAAEQQAVLDFIAAEDQATATAKATRLAKRPKRSELIAQVTAANSAGSIKALRKAVIALAAQNVAIMEYIGVDINEDV